MKKKGKSTREKILKETKDLVLQNGYVGTTIDMILEKTVITKGAFFYHFGSKSELASALMEEYVKDDLAELNNAMESTEHLQDNPLQRLIAFTDFFIEAMEGIKVPHPGCLYASYEYEAIHFSINVKSLIANSIRRWREAIAGMLDKVQESKLLKTEIDKEAVADMFVVIFEGSFVVSKAINDPTIVARQLRNYKNYIQMLTGI